LINTLKLACAQYPIDFLNGWSDYEAKITAWVKDAYLQEVQFLVFPEYFSMGLSSLFEAEVYGSLAAQLDAMQELHTPFVELYTRLSAQFNVHILAGTFPLRVDNGEYRNRAWLFRPDGTRDYQDKLQMTRFEAEQWHISPGDAIRVLDTDFGPIGVAICYDSEFPLIVRRQVEMGARLILAPSCTDTLAGYNRVRIGCQARALENQCFVAQSTTIGEARWSPAVDVNVGQAAVYTPVDRGFPDNGLLDQGPDDQTGWMIADLDFEALEKVRRDGQVLNHRDWDSQFRWLPAR